MIDRHSWCKNRKTACKPKNNNTWSSPIQQCPPIVMCAAREGTIIGVCAAWSQSSEHVIVSSSWLPCILSLRIHPVRWIRRLYVGDPEIAFSSVQRSVNTQFQGCFCLMWRTVTESACQQIFHWMKLFVNVSVIHWKTAVFSIKFLVSNYLAIQISST